jgi:toxin-antitoxin system PIN domain toxin
MMLPDANVLIYAFRQETPHHAVCRAWLDRAVLGDARFGVSPLALAAVVRITTQSRSMQIPSTLDDALGFCDDILNQPHCQVVEPRERHWDIFKRLCIETETRGRRVTDVWYAALAIEWGCEWVTMDRDFVRFPGLKWSMPGQGSEGLAKR